MRRISFREKGRETGAMGKEYLPEAESIMKTLAELAAHQNGGEAAGLIIRKRETSFSQKKFIRGINLDKSEEKGKNVNKDEPMN